MSEQQAEYTTETSITVEPSRKVLERRNGKLYETKRSAFVKVSTAFKSELGDIPGRSLKIWLYIALSLNRNTEQAFPGLRNIAENTNMAVNTVRKYLKPLQELGLLTIIKNNGYSNTYEVPFYVSANGDTVSNRDTVTDDTVSKNGDTVSGRVIHNQLNQINQKNQSDTPPSQNSNIKQPDESFPFATQSRKAESPKNQAAEMIGGVVGKLLPPGRDTREAIEFVNKMIGSFGADDVLEALEISYEAWSKSVTKSGKPYRKTNLAWATNWALEYLQSDVAPQVVTHEKETSSHGIDIVN